MEFYLGSSTTVLNAGDSVYFNSGIPHAMRALNGERVQFLAVVMGEPQPVKKFPPQFTGKMETKE